jgi:hypothetical protein
MVWTTSILIVALVDLPDGDAEIRTRLYKSLHSGTTAERWFDNSAGANIAAG